MLWKKTTPNDDSGFPPNVTVSSVATQYNRLAADLQCFPDSRILNCFVSEFENNYGERPTLTLTLHLRQKIFKIKCSGKKQRQTTDPDLETYID
jgi:hypothetical protein